MRQPTQIHDTGNNRAKRKKQEPIDWKLWWPFTPVTGEAYKQLNKREPKQLPVAEEGPL